MFLRSLDIVTVRVNERVNVHVAVNDHDVVKTL